MKLHLCTGCLHGPHPNRSCNVTTVSGPAIEGRDIRGFQEVERHEGRTVTPCGCGEYRYVNGEAK